MNGYNNAQILTAILNRSVQPLVVTFASSKFSSISAVQGIENWVRSTGWVSGNWSMMGELSPFVESISGSLVEPMIYQYVSKIPNDSIPSLAHSLIDKAIETGELSFMEGFITFEKPDLIEIKRLLNINLPLKQEASSYVLKTEVEQTPVTENV